MSLTFEPYQKLTAAQLTEVYGATVRCYSSTSARDAAITSPTAGMLAMVGSGSALTLYAYSGSAWKSVWVDTGWVTSGLTLTAATGWSVTSYHLRKIGDHARGDIVVSRSGASLTATAAGVISSEPDVLTLPSGWVLESGSQPRLAPMVNSTAGTVWWGRVLADGRILLSFGMPSQTFASGASMRISIDHLTA